MIILFNSSILQRDYHFVEEFFSFERWIHNDQIPRLTTAKNRETKNSFTSSTFTNTSTVPSSCHDYFFVSSIPASLSSLNVSLIISIENFGCFETFTNQGKRVLEWTRVQSRLRGTRNMPYIPVSCGTGHFFRDTRMKRERLLELCFGHQQAEIQQTWWGRMRECTRKSERQSGRIEQFFYGGRVPTKWHRQTVEEIQRCIDQKTKYPRVWADDQHWGANHLNLQGKNDSSFQLDNSSRRLSISEGILQF